MMETNMKAFSHILIWAGGANFIYFTNMGELGATVAFIFISAVLVLYGGLIIFERPTITDKKKEVK